ncbi:MAG: hypothetical protein GTO18_12175 [Anaerolineales bacterium]|nr:hypothetical protein [Anaerolineales bacterium]
MKTIIIGFDAFDPIVFENLYNQGKVPNLGKWVEHKGYSRFNVSNPAQSEVSWTSIATGLNPGGHGLFDFVHRNPADYSLHVSLLPTKKQFFGIQFTRPHNAHTIFDEAVQGGYPATALWWPATFPARLDSPVRTIPGLGTPDILGRLGTGTYFSLEGPSSNIETKTKIEALKKNGERSYIGQLRGPSRKKGSDLLETTVDFGLEMKDDETAELRIGKERVQLQKGVWSPMISITFKVQFGVSVRAITRAILTQSLPKPTLYFIPLQIHPLHPLWPYSNPRGFGKQNWKSASLYLTLGWPQDTTALDEGFIDDDQFLTLCDSIVRSRELIFLHQLRSFDEGILAVVFDTLDRVQHMFWRDRPDVIEAWYIKLDSLFGRILENIKQGKKDDPRILVVSDHGFAAFDQKVHLNRWLTEKGYLTAKEPKEQGGLNDLDWRQSQAYAVGLSSIYLNLEGREAQGIVKVEEVERLKGSLRSELMNWTGPDGRNVVHNVWFGEEAFVGPYVQLGPDLVVGFNTGYRGSAETGLGKWKEDALEANRDHWGADHCIDPALVQGTLFSNRSLEHLPSPSYLDIPQLVLDAPMEHDEGAPPPPPDFSDEDQDVLEERLKDLGYL